MEEIQVNVTTSVTRCERSRIKLTGKQIAAMLAKAGLLPNLTQSGCTVSVTCNGLDVDSDTPVEIDVSVMSVNEVSS